MSTPSRRVEAHLWLLLEEALVAIARGGADPWEIRRQFGYVTGAVAEAGIAPTSLTSSIRLELDDALAVRGLLAAASFQGAQPPDPAPETNRDNPDGAVVWLEAELERHLDLLAAYDPIVRPDAGAETLRILAAPARAFEAAGVLGAPGRALLADLTASVAAAGFDPGRPTPGAGRVRRDWVRFLRDRPPPPPAAFDPTASARPRMVLGRLRDRTVRVDEIAWTSDAIELHLALRPDEGIGRGEHAAWHARMVDPRGRVHLGQPAVPRLDGGASATLRLRPGLEDGVKALVVRVTSRGQRVEGRVAW
ncbi:MAG TPA: hypothetical protein VM143_04295 [Acidimicrobiales bacterium]|nr:hypothetical protein [Acidimicrobiales bacterium]